MNLFNAVFGTFKTAFSRSFWLGNFMPLAAAAFIHIVIAGTIFPEQVDVAEWFEGADYEEIPTLLMAISGLVVLAYAVSAITPLLRGALDGQFMPNWLAEILRRSRYEQISRLQARQTHSFTLFQIFGALRDQVAGGLERELPEDVKQMLSTDEVPPSDPDQREAGKLLDDAARALSRLEQSVWTGVTPNVRDVKAAFLPPHRIATAKWLAGAQEVEQHLTLFRERLLRCLVTATDLAEIEQSSIGDKLRFGLRLEHTQPTQMGDIRRLTERHAEVVYGVDFNYLWPRLQLLLEEDTSSGKSIQAAQAQSDFAVLSLAVTVTVPIVWFPIMALHGAGPGLIISVAAGALAAWIFFYQLAVESQAAYGSLVRALIDRKHLDVLAALSLPRPRTLSEERDLWKSLSQGDQGYAPSLRFGEPTASSAE